MTSAPALPATATVRSVRVADDTDLLAVLPDVEPTLAWVRDGEGMVAWGEAARLEVRGADRFRAAERWWRGLTSTLPVHDEVGVLGSGPVAFGSFAFSDDPHHSVIVMPRVVVGHRQGVTWLTTVEDDATAAPPALPTAGPPRRPSGLRYATGAMSLTDWRAAVAEAVRRIRRGDLAKVVLAHDLLALADDPIDTRFLLQRLAARYPDCWTFAVDGLVGATPELLVRRAGDAVASTVLAGTSRRSGDADGDRELAARLLSSPKDLAEHGYAVRSLAESLHPYVTDLDIPGGPRVLTLSNVLHLATDVTGTLAGGAGSLALAAAVHPTAAVGGTPTDAALALIAELETTDRGRYAGPVGWMDAHGDGEWAIALRCAQVEGARARLFAGCGIVADSDPDAEVAEAQAKFVPVRDALEGS